MGNLFSEHLKFDRLIDDENQIFIGIVNNDYRVVTISY